MTSAIWPSANGNRATASNLNLSPRSRGTATIMESPGMYSTSIHIAHAHADERLKDLRAEAAHERRANEAAQASRARLGIAGAAGNLRHNLGVTLVRVGHRLQHPAAPATEQCAPLGNLRTAR
jgi:hypothetical protein